MKTYFLILTTLLISVITAAQKNPENISLIPLPVSLQATGGFFTLPVNIRVSSNNQSPEVQQVIKQFSEKISKATGYNIQAGSNQPAISFNILTIQDSVIGNEGYLLTVTEKDISINANQPSGLFYGMQTLLQLFPPQILSTQKVNDVAWKIPTAKITDYPRFGWRGLMLDVARHFFTVQEVKDFIDQMAAYKYNRLHLHLTEDQGWRLHISSLPE